MLAGYYITPNSLLTQSLYHSHTTIQIFSSLLKNLAIHPPSLFSDNDLIFYFTEKIKLIREDWQMVAE